MGLKNICSFGFVILFRKKNLFSFGFQRSNWKNPHISILYEKYLTILMPNRQILQSFCKTNSLGETLLNFLETNANTECGTLTWNLKYLIFSDCPSAAFCSGIQSSLSLSIYCNLNILMKTRVLAKRAVVWALPYGSFARHSTVNFQKTFHGTNFEKLGTSCWEWRLVPFES